MIIKTNLLWLIGCLYWQTVHCNSKVQKGNGYKLSHTYIIPTADCTLTITYFVLPHTYSRPTYTGVHTHTDNYITVTLLARQRDALRSMWSNNSNRRSWREAGKKAETKADTQYPFFNRKHNTRTHWTVRQASLFCCLFHYFLFGSLKSVRKEPRSPKQNQW